MFDRALVTGGAGFLGSHLCARLLRLGAQVVAVDNLITGSQRTVVALQRHRRFQFHEADVSCIPSSPGHFDVVFHLASPASPVAYRRFPLETLKANSLGTWHYLELAHRSDARFVLASTSEVYGDPQEHPQRETYWGHVNPIGPRSVYDEGKRFGEAVVAEFVRSLGARAAIARIFNAYGPGMQSDDGRAVPSFIGKARAQEPLTVSGDGRQIRAFCYVDDIVNGLLALASSEAAGPTNLGSDSEVTVLELAHLIVELTGSQSPIVFMDTPPDDPRRRLPCLDVARTTLHWAPTVGIRDGLLRTIAAFGRPAEEILAPRAGRAHRTGARAQEYVAVPSLTSASPEA